MKKINISKKLVSSILTVAAVALVGNTVNAQTLLDKVSASGRPVVLFGDGSTALRPKIVTYSELLKQTFQEKNIPIEVVNAGFPSNTTAAALKRMPKDVLAKNPSLVIIQFGIMDSIVDVHKNPPAEQSRVPLPSFISNIETFIDAIRNQQGDVILMTPNRLAWHKDTRELYGKPPYNPEDPEGFNVVLDTYVQALRDLAARKNVTLIDINAAYQKYPAETGQPYSKLLLGGQTPNDRGHQLVYDLLMQKMSEKLPSN